MSLSIITSCSPKKEHQSKQERALNSWKKFGKVYDYQSPVNQIPTIQEIYNFGKSLDTDFIIVNADIEITSLPDFDRQLPMYLARYHRSFHKDRCYRDEWGIDLLYFPKDVNINIPSYLVIGKPCRDYVVPFLLIESYKKIQTSLSAHIRHEIHPEARRDVFHEYIEKSKQFLGQNPDLHIEERGITMRRRIDLYSKYI